MQESKVLSSEAWQAICDDADVISSHSVYGPKVIHLKSGDYIKVFNVKSGLTKRRWFPKYKTFIRNAARLNEMGFRTITVTAVYALPHIQAYAVAYHPIDGEDFRHVMMRDPAMAIGPLMAFIAALHEKGIYFHGMHLGNILYNDAGEFGIIDMADLAFYRAPLRVDLRVRQLRRLLRYHLDCPYFEHIGFEKVISMYREKAGLKGLNALLFWLMSRSGLVFD